MLSDYILNRNLDIDFKYIDNSVNFPSNDKLIEDKDFINRSVGDKCDYTSSWVYRYDKNGNTIFYEGDRIIETMGYDDNNNIISYSYNEKETGEYGGETYEYDNYGNLSRIVGEGGGLDIIIEHFYMPEGTNSDIKPGSYIGVKLIDIAVDGKTIEQEQWTYDFLADGSMLAHGYDSENREYTLKLNKAGQLVYEENWDGEIDTFTYNERGHLIEVVFTDKNGKIYHHEQHEYTYRDEEGEENDRAIIL